MMNDETENRKTLCPLWLKQNLIQVEERDFYHTMRHGERKNARKGI